MNGDLLLWRVRDPDGFLWGHQQAPDHRFKVLQRHIAQVRIEGGHVIFVAKGYRVLKPRMIFVFVAHVLIQADMFEIIVALEGMVVGDQPVVLFADEGL